MTRKRKQVAVSALDLNAGQQSRKRRKLQKSSHNTDNVLDHATLQLFFSSSCTLRHYLLSKLPICAKKRRNRLASLGQQLQDENSSQNSLFGSRVFKDASTASSRLRALASVASVLDTTYVCRTGAIVTRTQDEEDQDFICFSQDAGRENERSRLASSMSMSDLVDYVVWLLFNRVHRNIARPPHLLCHGFQKTQSFRRGQNDRHALADSFGLSMRFLNRNVSILKGATWDAILVLLGQGGEKIMLELLLECNVFTRLSPDSSNLSQLSGTPLQDIRPLDQGNNKASDIRSLPAQKSTSFGRPPSSIIFVRSRAYHSRPALNARGQVTFGLRHIHALNRYKDPENIHHTLHLAKYIFPRQFGLHNAFTSKVDTKETAQPFKDYTLREREIAAQTAVLPRSGKTSPSIVNHIPKRLRGLPLELIRRLQKLHSQCSYFALLEHYCPQRISRNHDSVPATEAQHTSSSSSGNSASQGPRCAPKLASIAPQDTIARTVTDLATPDSQVSAFCRATISTIVPKAFWGDGELGKANKQVIMQSIDRFIRLRKFENLSLHAVMQKVKIACITWLVPPKHLKSNIALPDFQKRQEMFSEFLYYVFDSILIPLIRSTFHLTESSAHQNRLFYFRHDIWRDATEPAMAHLKSCLYEPISFANAKRLLDSRTLGFSQVRMIPKTSGMRPIINLRRRMTKLYKGRAAFGRSVNSLLTPVFNVLDFEKKTEPTRLGSSMFSVNDMHPKIQRFRNEIFSQNRGVTKLYFAKVDAKSCFDTIPQRAIIQLIVEMINKNEYRLARHAEIKNNRSFYYRRQDTPKGKPAMKFLSRALASDDFQDFNTWVQEKRMKKSSETVFVDSIVQQGQSTRTLLRLLSEHVQGNLVKIGKKFFRQKEGIPQGSVLSSLLCNFFYGELERKHLSFLDDGQSLLLRLIDDFLVITPCKEHAQRFLKIMSAGIPAYGVEVNLKKSLSNFPIELDGCKVPRVSDHDGVFPYCGMTIDMRTLEIRKDRERRRATVLADSLSVDRFRSPGQAFYRKALNSFKIQSLRMLTDTNLNKPTTVLCTIYQNFSETAMKFFRYSKCMMSGGRPPFPLAIGTIRDLIDIAYVLLTARNQGHTARGGGYNCSVSKRQIAWLAVQAFTKVLSRKQTQYRDVLCWLDVAGREQIAINETEIARLENVVAKGDKAYTGYKY